MEKGRNETLENIKQHEKEKHIRREESPEES